MKKTVILVATILAMAGADALAQQAPPQGQGGSATGQGGDRGSRGRRGGGDTLIIVLDLNSDGTLDSREIQSAPRSLRTLDKNKDFKLTPDELGTRGARGKNMSQRMLEMDTNKDGKLSADEVPERMQRFIERMDTDGDGSVDKAEMEAFQKEMQRRFEEGGSGRGGRGGPDRGSAPQGSDPQD